MAIRAYEKDPNMVNASRVEMAVKEIRGSKSSGFDTVSGINPDFPDSTSNRPKAVAHFAVEGDSVLGSHFSWQTPRFVSQLCERKAGAPPIS